MSIAEHTPVLLDGVRTPFGKYLKGLSSVPSRELGAQALAALLERQEYLRHCDGVLLAQVLQAGQGQNPARQVAASAGVDPTVPALTLNNVCLGGMASVADASRRIRLGDGSAYLVGGMDSMSRAPHVGYLRQGAAMDGLNLVDSLSTDGLWCALVDESMGIVAEQSNTQLSVDRDAQDEIALRSHDRAAAARDAGRLAEEIVPIQVNGHVIDQDEGIRATSRERLASLRPAFTETGTITAGNASQMTDGASMGAVTSAAVAERAGVQPLARIAGYAEVAGPDASLHLKPANAVRQVLERADVTMSDVAVLEINEAFAGVVEASRRDLSVPMDIVNVNGGAIALGHPLGGTGFRLVLTLARELARRGERYGVGSLCGGGGQGAAVLLENLN